LQHASRVRQDDNAIDKRMREHNTQVEPMIDQLREEGKLCEVNGVGTIAQVKKRLRRSIG